MAALYLLHTVCFKTIGNIYDIPRQSLFTVAWQTQNRIPRIWYGKQDAWLGLVNILSLRKRGLQERQEGTKPPPDKKKP